MYYSYFFKNKIAVVTKRHKINSMMEKYGYFQYIDLRYSIQNVLVARIFSGLNLFKRK